MDDMENLLRFFTELRQELDHLTQLQQQNIEAVRAHDLEVLNGCMKQEQAVSLALRGLEQKREKLLEALGLSGVPLLELDRRCPPKYRGEVAQATDKVRKQYALLRSAQEAARTVVEKDLRAVNQELERRGLRSESDDSYQTPSSSPLRGMGADFRA